MTELRSSECEKNAHSCVAEGTMVSPRTPHFKVGACAALRFFAKVSVFFAPPAKLEIETTLKWGDGGGTSGMKGLGPVSVFFAPTGNQKMCVSSMGHAQARQIYPARIPRATARVRARVLPRTARVSHECQIDSSSTACTGIGVCCTKCRGWWDWRLLHQM